jgi:hypothetical protein
MSTLQVYKVTRTCDACGDLFSYYRLKDERGRAPSNCKPDCKGKFYKSLNRELVDFADVPPVWQQRLYKTAEKQALNTPGVS